MTPATTLGIVFAGYVVIAVGLWWKGVMGPMRANLHEFDPAHAAFEVLAQNEINVKGLPKFSVKAVPVKSGDGSEFANMIEVATAFGFSDDESPADTIWSLNYGEVLDPTRLPQGVKLTIPLVASSQSDWQGPFPIDESSEGLAMETYGEGSAVGMIERIKEVVGRFGEQQIFLPDIDVTAFETEQVFFFD